MMMNSRNRLLYILPLLGFALLAGFLFKGLSLKPSEVPSPFIGKAAPAFSLPQLTEPQAMLTVNDFKGAPWVLNIFASWCVACRDEHPVITDMAQRLAIPVVGLDYKDEPADASRWLAQFGNPYDRLIVDHAGQTGIDWGVYGVPETFVMDAEGIVRYKHIGPLSPEALNDVVMPLLEKLQSEKS